MESSLVRAEPSTNGTRIVVLAKAPLPGFAKTRLIPALGAWGAARLHRQLTIRTVRTALQARLGDVMLWCAPDTEHRLFRALRGLAGVECMRQPEGDLGARMHAAFLQHSAHGHVLLIGTDCPALRASHLRQASKALDAGADAVFHPAEDGGYVLVGLRAPQPGLFSGIAWGTDEVMRSTRERARALGLNVREFAPLWDVDRPEDLARLGPRGAKTCSLPRTPRERR